MSKTNVILLLVAAGAVSLSISPGRMSSGTTVAGAEQAQKGEANRERWEYKVVEYGYGYADFKGTDKSLTGSLNKMSKDGWEYVGPLTQETIITTKKTGFPTSEGARAFVVFKRPRK
jgi:hypothetical protein